MSFFLSQSCYTLLSYKSWAFNLVPWVSVQMNHPPWRWKMDDIVKKMQEIPCFQSLHHEEEDVVRSLQEILVIILQEYRHRFGENIHHKLLSAWLLLVHLKVIERATRSKVFFELGWQNVVHVVGLERGDHIIISLKAHSKFHMYVFDGTKGVKKEN